MFTFVITPIAGFFQACGGLYFAFQLGFKEIPDCPVSVLETIVSSVELAPMQFESLESRRLLTTATPDVDVFEYSSQTIDREMLLALQQGEQDFSETHEWHKPVNYSRPAFNQQGHMVAVQYATQLDPHTMYVAKAPRSSCFGLEGIYTQQRMHHMVSFDIRYPRNAESWLDDHSWAIVMQAWGPRETGEIPINPPLMIYTTADRGETLWKFAGIGDARRTTISRDYDFQFNVAAPFEGIDRWYHWDVEFVIDPFGRGLARAWLDGEIVAEFRDIQLGFHAQIRGETSGPLNPSFGVYSSRDSPRKEVHFDNMRVACNGAFGTSIAGVVEADNDVKVSARNLSTGKEFETLANRVGVYALNVPPGRYVVLATDTTSGASKSLQIDVRHQSRTVDLVIPSVAPTSTPGGEPDSTVEPPSDPPIENEIPPAEETDLEAEIVPDVAEPQVPEPDVPEPAPAKIPQRLTMFGDVDGNGTQDAIAELQGLLFVSLRHNSSLGRFTLYGMEPGMGEWEFVDRVVGDFDGDGLDDLAMRRDDNEWWVMRSNGNRFESVSWGAVHLNSPRGVRTGDFNGDGKDDLLLLSSTFGTKGLQDAWYVAIAGDQEFHLQRWDFDAALPDWNTLLQGDFNGDGKDDFAGQNESGHWMFVIAAAQAFQTTSPHRAPYAFERVLVADVVGDHQHELIALAPNGKWRTIHATGRYGALPYRLTADDEAWLDQRDREFDENSRFIEEIILALMADAESLPQNQGLPFRTYYDDEAWTSETDWLFV